MNTYTARLMQESGVQGPSTLIESENFDTAAAEARDWAEGQIGHPWDTLTLQNEETGDVIDVAQ